MKGNRKIKGSKKRKEKKKTKRDNADDTTDMHI
jgi:hypothetical protein